MLLIKTHPMRQALLAVCVAAALIDPAPVFAHADHGKPMHGGVVAEAGAFQGELVAVARALTLHISHHGEPIAMGGGSAKAIVLSGKDKSELSFAPAGSNRLTATAAAPLSKGSKLAVTVKLPDGRTGVLRFELR